ISQAPHHARAARFPCSIKRHGIGEQSIGGGEGVENYARKKARPQLIAALQLQVVNEGLNLSSACQIRLYQSLAQPPLPSGVAEAAVGGRRSKGGLAVEHSKALGQQRYSMLGDQARLAAELAHQLEGERGNVKGRRINRQIWSTQYGGRLLCQCCVQVG